MLFQFRMRKMDDVTPFDEDGQPTLHWFGLTDGWYWLIVDGQETFRYTDKILRQWGIDKDDPPYVDYYVVRLWEDVLEILPFVLNPIPPEVTAHLFPPEEWLAWFARASTWIEANLDNDEAWSLYIQATGWWSNRQLDTAYLEAAPDLTFWRTGDEMHIHWDGAGRRMEGTQVWACEYARETLPVDTFTDRVESFHRAFFTEMRSRVDSARKSWKRPDIELDKTALYDEHKERSTWLSRRLADDPGLFADDWDRVLEAIQVLDARL
ncbi:MAG: hypothetical protein GYB64_08755 [Chloroflexi bacterium]|nr:hypothetical protein [Chloroflexota bacterium]